MESGHRPIDIPPMLFSRVMGSIAEARVRQLRRRLFAAFLALAGSLAYVAANWSAFLNEVRGSSFGSLARLLLTDRDILFANLHDYGLALVESLPLGVLLIGSAILFCSLESLVLGVSVRQARKQLLSVSHS
ncbi:MAG: hypothetical protein Q7R83_02285 [bacterium]|nr:hypothetical protein [bacterium]